MAVVAVHSSKGGVGKTTIATNRGWCSAQLSARRTLLWDIDPADGAGFMFALEAQRKRQARSLFAGDIPAATLIQPSSYDRLILDCPPVLNELSAQVMRAATLVIVPLPPSPLSARALDHVVEEIRRHTTRPPPILPVYSMVDRRRSLHLEALAANPAWPAIPMVSSLEQCAVQRRPIGTFAPRTPAALAFGRLWEGVERKIAQIAATPAQA
jgi:cellulose biosynthesis protein BcsQ